MIANRKSIFFVVALSCHMIVLGQSAVKEKEAVDYVNPLIGTAVAGFEKGLDGGGTMPFANLPYAMTNFVAQTRENKMGSTPYVYEDSTIMGFLATHQPTVWMGDYGYVSVMPQTGQLKVLPKDRALSFDHAHEVSKPYYYSVDLRTGNGEKIKAEMSSASRCGILEFTFPQSDQSHLIIQGINLNPDLTDWANDYQPRMKAIKGYIQVNKNKSEITGYNPDRQSAQLGPELKSFKGYFVIQFDKPFESFGTWNSDSIYTSSDRQYGTRAGAYISFKTKKNERIKVRIATSFISIEQARENLNREITGWDLNKLADSTRAAWQRALSRMQVKGISEEKKHIFFTALFHCMLFPREFSEYGRYYSAFDDKVHEGLSYNDYSLWDTFRALHPLLLFIQPERVSGMIQSLLQMYKEGGWMPMWPNPSYTNIMIGTHADAVIADAYVKGVRGYDVNLAYEAMHKDSYVAPDGDTDKRWGDRDRWTSFEAKGGLTYYHALGYVPIDRTNESVSRTIEYSIDDYCVAQVAKGLGKTEDYKQLMAWSENYRNVYNKSTGFATPRNYDGQWNSNLDSGFTEGSKWTYTFGAMHAVPGMMEQMGGRKKFAELLSRNFDENHYRPDNEPGHHYCYLFDYCGMPWKTQELVRKHTSSENYRNEAIGINGNDDCGQTSAWYLFSVMGFYPVSPGSGQYAIGAPQFPSISLGLGGGKKLEIVAKGLSPVNKYVRSVSLNGVLLKEFFISHAEISRGGKLVFEMTDKPGN